MIVVAVRAVVIVVIIVIVTVDGPQEAVEGTFGDELYRLIWRSMRI
jgi:hypothetical protein